MDQWLAYTQIVSQFLESECVGIHDRVNGADKSYDNVPRGNKRVGIFVYPHSENLMKEIPTSILKNVIFEFTSHMICN